MKTAAKSAKQFGISPNLQKKVILLKQRHVARKQLLDPREAEIFCRIFKIKKAASKNRTQNTQKMTFFVAE